MRNTGTGPGVAAMRRMSALSKKLEKRVSPTKKVFTGIIFSDGSKFHRDEHLIVQRFKKLVEKDGWCSDFDWSAWKKGRSLSVLSRLAERGSLPTIRKIITCLVRGERFCDGVLESAHRQGLLLAIANRIQVIETQTKESK